MNNPLEIHDEMGLEVFGECGQNIKIAFREGERRMFDTRTDKEKHKSGLVRSKRGQVLINCYAPKPRSEVPLRQSCFEVFSFEISIQNHWAEISR